MAEIKPFRGWRYAPDLLPHIEQLVSPLFDVISEKQRNRLYREPYNSIHLCVPKGERPELAALAKLKNWKQIGVLQQDQNPTIYVYYQYFYLPNDPQQHVRKGFMAMIKATDYKENIVLRHENTMPAAVGDRVRLLKVTKLNSSATHGLYSDPSHALEPYMDAAMEKPLFTIEDYQGVTDALALIDQPEVVSKFVALLKDKPVILADGHHRYESSVQYRDICEAQNPQHTGDEPYNFHLMYLSNTEKDNFRILPTHRLLKKLIHFNEEEMVESVAEYFHLKPVDTPECLSDMITGKRHTFGWILPKSAYTLQLKKGKLAEMKWHFPEIVKQLDLTILHYFILEKVLGIKGQSQRNTPHVSFERNVAACLSAVEQDKVQMAFITNEVTIEQVKQVCYSGYTLPQKSTYFYPKVIAGLVYAPIEGEVL